MADMALTARMATEYPRPPDREGRRLAGSGPRGQGVGNDSAGAGTETSAAGPAAADGDKKGSMRRSARRMWVAPRSMTGSSCSRPAKTGDGSIFFCLLPDEGSPQGSAPAVVDLATATSSGRAIVTAAWLDWRVPGIWALLGVNRPILQCPGTPASAVPPDGIQG